MLGYSKDKSGGDRPQFAWRLYSRPVVDRLPSPGLRKFLFGRFKARIATIQDSIPSEYRKQKSIRALHCQAKSNRVKVPLITRSYPCSFRTWKPRQVPKSERTYVLQMICQSSRKNHLTAVATLIVLPYSPKPKVCLDQCGCRRRPGFWLTPCYCPAVPTLRQHLPGPGTHLICPSRL